MTKLIAINRYVQYVYERTDPQTGLPQRLDEMVYASSHSLHGPLGLVFDEMILANEAAGIGIYDTHSEIGPGQFEIGDLDGLKRF